MTARWGVRLTHNHRVGLWLVTLHDTHDPARHWHLEFFDEDGAVQAVKMLEIVGASNIERMS